MKIRIVTVIAAAVLALTACTHTTLPHADTSSDTTTVAPTPEPTLTPDDMTDAIVDLTWNQTSEDDKDAMCFGLALQGPEWAAEQMQAGAGTDTTGIDWDRAAELVEAKCAQR